MSTPNALGYVMQTLNMNTVRQEIQQFIAGADEGTLLEIHNMLKTSSTGVTWWDDITDAQKASIERGIRDMETSKTETHGEVQKLYAQWLTK